MLSQTAEYALRAVVCLAQNPGRPMVTQQIAVSTKVPQGYLSKVLQTLAKAGLVRSHRGIHGGFELAAQAQAMSILDVLNAVDPVQRIRQRPLGLEAHGEDLCALHRRLDEAVALAERGFAETTIADLLAEPSPSKPLCTVREAVLAGAPAAAPRRGAATPPEPPRRAAAMNVAPLRPAASAMQTPLRPAPIAPPGRRAVPVDNDEEGGFARPLRHSRRRLGEHGA